MTKIFQNEMINIPALNELSILHTVTFDEEVVGFKFHSLSVTDAHHGIYSAVHGVTVEPRFVWAAIFAFHQAPTKAVMKDGREIWCGQLTHSDPRGFQFDLREIRLGADIRGGRVVATCQRQEAWVRPERKAE